MFCVISNYKNVISFIGDAIYARKTTWRLNESVTHDRGASEAELCKLSIGLRKLYNDQGRTAVREAHGGPIDVSPETPRTSQQYCTEGFEGALLWTVSKPDRRSNSRLTFLANSHHQISGEEKLPHHCTSEKMQSIFLNRGI